MLKKVKTIFKRLMLQCGSSAVALALVVGQLSANVACKSQFYQPKVPAQLLKD